MKRILITNDDGFESAGLNALVEAMQGLGQITIVAPTTEKSACGRSLTLTKPLRFVELDDDFYKLDDGTPTDCIYLALHALFEENVRPDLIVSGINKGANMGEDVSYSGTASGALEGATHGIPSISFSQVCQDRCQGIDMFDFELAKWAARELAQKVMSGSFPLPHRHILNVNVPMIPLSQSRGFKATCAGYRLYGNSAQLNRNPRGEEYYWLGLHPLQWDPQVRSNSDFEAIQEGYVSVTPVKLDMTAHEEVEQLNSWL